MTATITLSWSIYDGKTYLVKHDARWSRGQDGDYDNADQMMSGKRRASKSRQTGYWDYTGLTDGEYTACERGRIRHFAVVAGEIINH